MKIKQIVHSTIGTFGYTITKKLERRSVPSGYIKFDFVIFSGGRTGSKATQNFLNSRNKIFIPSRKELDIAMRNGPEGLIEFTKKYSPIIRELKKTEVKIGLVVHDHILALREDILEAFAKISKSAIFIVRNPNEVVTSTKRHLMYYSVSPIAYKLFDPNLSRSMISTSDFSPKVKKVYKNILSCQLSSLHYLHYAEKISNHFKKFSIFEYEKIFKKNGFKDLLDFIGCSDNGKDNLPLSTNGSHERYFRYCPFDLVLPTGSVIRVRFHPGLNFSNSIDEHHWVGLQSYLTTEIPYLGFKSFIILVRGSDFIRMTNEERFLLQKHCIEIYGNVFCDTLKRISSEAVSVDLVITKMLKSDFDDGLGYEHLLKFENTNMHFYEDYL